ncbi:hypothetical protein Gpo141_00009692 [Globisporangium polare]
MVSISALLSCAAFLATAATSAAFSINAPQQPAIVADEQPYSLAVNTSTRAATQTLIPAKGATFITVHFSQFNLAQGDKVVVRDVQGLTKFEYSGLGRGDLGQRGGFFSSRVPGDQAIVEFQPSADSSVSGGDFGFTVDKISRSSTSGSSSTVCGTDDSRPAKCFTDDISGSLGIPEAYAKSQAVARLFMIGTGEVCTGWLVGSEGHLITNAHCIDSHTKAANTDFELGAESSSCSEECQSLAGCKIGKLVASTSELIAFDAKIDYALVKLQTVVDLSSYGHMSLRVSGPIEGEQIYIPQHPGGWATRIAAVDDSDNVTRIGGVSVETPCGSGRVEYTADTREGSSGSPVLAASDNRVVTLHSCGPSKDAKTCTNSGVDIRSVIWDLRKKNVTLPDDAFSDPKAEIREGAWVPGFGVAPAPATLAPTKNVPESTCKVYRAASCAVISGGRCMVNAGLCIPTPAFIAQYAATPAPPAP